MGSKFIPLGAEGPRTLDTVAVELHWLMPWCCWGCRSYGKVEVVVEETRRSTDDEVFEKIDRSHRNKSTLCPRLRSSVIVGRVYRVRPSGQKIYLRANGEREEDVKEQAWPPWQE